MNQLIGDGPRPDGEEPTGGVDDAPEFGDPDLDHPGADGRRRFTRAILVAGVGSLLPYLAVLWNFGFQPLRTALNNGIFSNFFDLQARSIMHGHLAVTPGSLSIEGFIINNKEYTYFPPGPALLRIPFFAVTNRLDGRFTALSMLMAWIVTAVMLGLLLWRVRVAIRGRTPVTKTEIVASGIVFASVMCGSVILFLGSMPWVYHEVYAWAIAMSVGAFHALLGFLQRPSWKGAAAAGGFSLGAILCRTTSGWACTFTLIGSGVYLLLSRQRRDDRRWALPIGAAGGVALLIGIAANYAKFRHPFMFPLQNQVWTGLNAHRRAALAANGGDLVSANIIWSTTVNYLRPNGVRFISAFPFITLPAKIAQSYGGGYLDQTYRTGSITACAPLLVFLSVAGLFASFRRGASGALKLLRIPMIGAAGITGGIMFYGYLAYRYTSEFMPFLIVAAVVGITTLVHRYEASSRRRKMVMMGAIACAAVYGLGANMAFALQQTYISNPGSMLRDYVVLQRKISDITGHPLNGFVRRSAELPRTGTAERLQIVGDCDAMFVGTGEPLNPWVPVEVRDVAFALQFIPSTKASPASYEEAKVAIFEGLSTSTLLIRSQGDGFQVGLRNSDGVVYTDVISGNSSDLVIRALTDQGQFAVVVDGRELFRVDMSQRDQNWYQLPVVVRPIAQPTVQPLATGWHVDRMMTPPVLSCTQLGTS